MTQEIGRRQSGLDKPAGNHQWMFAVFYAEKAKMKTINLGPNKTLTWRAAMWRKGLYLMLATVVLTSVINNRLVAAQAPLLGEEPSLKDNLNHLQLVVVSWLPLLLVGLCAAILVTLMVLSNQLSDLKSELKGSISGVSNHLADLKSELKNKKSS
jgi:hypothetical protein